MASQSWVRRMTHSDSDYPAKIPVSSDSPGDTETYVGKNSEQRTFADHDICRGRCKDL